ncbi:hypothetical protein KAT08_00300 [Candidatus Babeliales bacterium]|nr:hypothetical protein [Candidatus Babeliales bacterium]
MGAPAFAHSNKLPPSLKLWWTRSAGKPKDLGYTKKDDQSFSELNIYLKNSILKYEFGEMAEWSKALAC